MCVLHLYFVPFVTETAPVEHFTQNALCEMFTFSVFEVEIFPSNRSS